MFQQNLNDAAILIQNILYQPLSIPNPDKDITQLSIALNFNQDGIPSCYFDYLSEDCREFD